MIERILVASDDPGDGLIAMSGRPRSRLRYVVTGSVSPAVIMRAGRSVLVVREPGIRV